MNYNITINLSKLFALREPWDCSNSVGNLGPRAGELTWGCAMELAAEHAQWLTSDLSDALEAIRANAGACGAWDREDIAQWPAQECLAYLVQCLATDLRMCGSDDNDLAECLEYYQVTNWDAECEYPTASLYAGADGDVMADWYGGC